MKLAEIIKLKECPSWLKSKSIKVENENIEIIDGIVTWEDGIWKGGIWEYGIWKDGIWEYGTWKGGIWKGGTWKGGTWKDGTWKDGFIQIGKCKWLVFYNYKKQIVKIGCKENSIANWVDWFNSDDEFETKRNTKEFSEIYNSFLLAKLAIELELTIR